MAVFNYKVVDRDGKNKKGTIEASNKDGAEAEVGRLLYHEPDGAEQSAGGHRI